jgi:hypothetical protein
MTYMKFTPLVGALAVAGHPALAGAADPAANELHRYLSAQCEQYAREDRVPAAELPQYLQMCIEDLSGAANGAPVSANPSPSKQAASKPPASAGQTHQRKSREP